MGGVTIVTVSLPYYLIKDYKKEKAKRFKNMSPEFEKIYNQLYDRTDEYGLELMRKRTRNMDNLSGISFIIGFVILFIGVNRLNLLLMSCGIFFIFISFRLIAGSKYSDNYEITYKRAIISKFVKLINDKLEFRTNDVNDSKKIENIYKSVYLINSQLYKVILDDYIEGIVGDNIYIEMADLEVSSYKKHNEEWFCGMFAQTECNKDIGTDIRISSNQLLSNPEEKVEMDSAEFEKYFDIYSEDKILAMQLLTSDVMSILVDFYNRHNLEFEILIKNNKIYMRFFTGAIFEPKLFINAMDKQELFEYYCIIKFIVDVTKAINKAVGEVEI